MSERRELGKISFELDAKELEVIASAGKLGPFVDKATELFKQAFKAELVNNASAGTMQLVRLDDWEYGNGGPRGPFPHIFTELETLATKVKTLEGHIRLLE